MQCKMAMSIMDKLIGVDVREGALTAWSGQASQPQFEGHTKTKLGNSEVKGWWKPMER